jgi:hypothetical protein
MRPTFSRFDIHDLFDTLPPFVRSPMALATMASVLAHGLIAVGLPVFAGSEEKKPERVVDVISLSPAEQGKLPSNGLMIPGGGLNGTSALPLPLTKNGAFSPLSGLSGSTLGSSGSPYSGVPGLLDPPVISYTQPSSRTNSDSIFKPTKPQKAITGYTGTTAIDIAELIQKSQPEEKPTDPTKGKDNTAMPPGEKPPASDTIASLPPGNTGGTPAKTPETPNPTPAGTLNDGNTPPSPTATPSPTITAALPAQIAYGNPEPDSSNREAASAAFSDAQTTLLKALEQVDRAAEIDQKTAGFLNDQELKRPLILPKTSDIATQKPRPAEFLVLRNPDGTLFTLPGPDGKTVLLQIGLLRGSGYAALTAQVATELQQQLPALQEEVKQQMAQGKLKKFDTYSYLKIIIQPTPATEAS